MNTLLIKTTLSAAIALTIAGCFGGSSGGGGSTAGIGGSGFVSSGSVSGFGSVFVNGVEFETDSATFDVDGDLDGTQNDLAIGMIVKVHGSINDDGETGTATSISFDEEIQGPVSAIGACDADGVKCSITVLGLTAIIDSGSTTFDVDDSLAGTTFDFDTIAVNNNIEVSGFISENGDLHATRVELKDIAFVADSSVIEVKGEITGLTGTKFNLVDMGSLSVDALTAAIDGLSTLVNGQLVEVVGTGDAVLTAVIKAERVEREDNSVDDTDEFEIEGIITGLAGTTFKLGDLTVDASNASFEPLGLSLKNDIRIEAEGEVINGILIANEIELEGGDIKIHAKVTSVDLNANTFNVEPVPGQPEITITVTSGTQLESDVSIVDPYTLIELSNDLGFVEVRCFDDGNGGITAVEVNDTGPAPTDVMVQSIIQSDASAGTVKVLGVEFMIEDPGQTGFDDINDSPAGISQAEFFSTVILDTTLIKVQDDVAADGIADEIDIESSP